MHQPTNSTIAQPLQTNIAPLHFSNIQQSTAELSMIQPISSPVFQGKGVI